MVSSLHLFLMHVECIIASMVLCSIFTRVVDNDGLNKDDRLVFFAVKMRSLVMTLILICLVVGHHAELQVRSFLMVILVYRSCSTVKVLVGGPDASSCV
jgi:hypothetical protein